jgi:single-strand DNA-binding protein
MVNKVTLIGNLGRDPEVFQTQSGRAVARLSIATNEVWMKDGERQRRTEWHRVVVWGPRAERTTELRKGTPVYVEGRSGRGRLRMPTTSSRCGRRFTASACSRSR